MATWFRGDCLERMKSLPDKSIQLILWDPPFATTQNKWDEALDWAGLFKECFRVLKDDGMLVIHCSIPFNYTLIRAAPKPPSYSWYWVKETITCPMLANHQPLRKIEEILVWKKQKNTYYRQQIGEETRTAKYKPNSCKGYYDWSKGGQYEIKGKTRSHLLEFKRDIDGFSTRPAALIELMIKSYTKEGDTILDPTCYKGISGVIAKRLGRRWIGIDKHFYPLCLLNGIARGS